jgi:hypothetical protein
MNAWIRVGGGLALAGIMTGCVVRIGGTRDEGQSTRDERSKPPLIVVPAAAEDGPVLAEIDAAAKLSFDSGRVEALRNVASRPTLSPAAQAHLVNTAMRSLQFEASKVSVLGALIENPAFSPTASETIFRQLDHLQFDSSRTAIMRRVQARMAGG